MLINKARELFTLRRKRPRFFWMRGGEGLKATIIVLLTLSDPTEATKMVEVAEDIISEKANLVGGALTLGSFVVGGKRLFAMGIADVRFSPEVKKKLNGSGVYYLCD